LVGIYGAWPQRTDPEVLVQTLKYLDPVKRLKAVEALSSASLPLEPAAKPLGWDQVRSMQAGGIEFGGHTVTHPILSLLSRESQEQEVLLSQQRIHEETGVSPKTFAYPNGSGRDFTDETVEIVRRVGYQAACTTRKGSNKPGCNPMTLLRLGIGSDPTWVLEARVAGLFDEEVRRHLRRPRRGTTDA
jgi:peptidoglycan/xylan/chitin deacetylase (PgdA/CDA1 family)